MLLRCASDVAVGAGSSHKTTIIVLGVVLGLIAMVAAAAVASVMNNVQFGDIPQLLQSVFQRRGTVRHESDYQEMGPTGEREPLVP